MNVAVSSNELIDCQIFGDVVDSGGKNMLSVAIESNNQEVFDNIMALPARVRKSFTSVSDHQGRFPVEVAFESSNIYYLKVLLDKDPLLVNQQNMNNEIGLLHRLARFEVMGFFSDLNKEKKAIIEAANPNPFIRNRRGETPQETINRMLNVRSEQVEMELTS